MQEQLLETQQLIEKMIHRPLTDYESDRIMEPILENLAEGFSISYTAEKMIKDFDL